MKGVLPDQTKKNCNRFSVVFAFRSFLMEFFFFFFRTYLDFSVSVFFFFCRKFHQPLCMSIWRELRRGSECYLAAPLMVLMRQVMELCGPLVLLSLKRNKNLQWWPSVLLCADCRFASFPPPPPFISRSQVYAVVMDGSWLDYALCS